MSICNADDSHSTTNLYALHISSHPNKTTYRKAMNDIRSNIKKWASLLASWQVYLIYFYTCSTLCRRVHIYSFNVHSEQLESAHALLDKEEERKSMRLVDIIQRPNFWLCFRVMYSDDHNFIVRYMPGPVHKEAHVSWDHALLFALVQLTPPPHSLPPGCKGIAAMSMFDKTHNWSRGLAYFLQPSNLDQGKSRQMPVSGLPHLAFLALSSRLGIQKVLPSWKLIRGFGLNTCMRLANFFLCCCSLTRTYSGTAGHSSFNWSPHCPPPRSSKNHHPIVERFCPPSPSMLASRLAKRSLHGLGCWLDSCCNTIIYTTFWHLQRTGACSLW